MLILKSIDFITNGGERAVYRHPAHRNLCVKVLQRGGTRPEETAGEVRYWLHLERRGCDFARMPRFAGWAETNLGSGVIWQLILSDDGALAPSLPAALRGAQVSPAACWEELLRFKQWSLAHGVLTRDLHPRNFVCRFERAGALRLFLVDGWGNGEFIPLSSWLSILGRSKIERRWARFTAEFERLLQSVDRRRQFGQLPPPRRRRAA